MELNIDPNFAKFLPYKDPRESNLKNYIFYGKDPRESNLKNYILYGKTAEEIVINHYHWLKEDIYNWESMRGDLSHKFLKDADFSQLYLSKMNFSWCGAYDASFQKANLAESVFNYASLSDSNFDKADLEGASFLDANLSGVSFINSNLRTANFSYSCLNGADLTGADITGADFYRSSFDSATKMPYFPMVCPEEGSFIAWKAAGDHYQYLIKLLIPEQAARSSGTTRKCRASAAKVLGIYNIEGNPTDLKIVESNYDFDFHYIVGEMSEVDNFNTNRWDECSQGIHFFMQKQEVLNFMRERNN